MINFITKKNNKTIKNKTMKNKIINMKLQYIISILFVILLLTGCADVSPHVQGCITSSSYGFFGGVWHGFVLPISWLGSLLMDDVAIYAYNNNGGWYDFGFAIGAYLISRITILYSK